MNKPLNRHEFFRSMGRMGMFAGLGALGVESLRRSRSEECVNLSYCAACQAYKVCELPEKKGLKR